MVGILVEETLKAQAGFYNQNFNHLINNKLFNKENNMDESTINYNGLDKLISDKG